MEMAHVSSEKKNSEILSFVDSIKTPATVEEFVAMEKFVANSAVVTVCKIWPNFDAWFRVDNGGKIEHPIREQVLQSLDLRVRSHDGPILKAVGGRRKAKTSLSQVWSLIREQAHGKDGHLITTGNNNVFYVLDAAGILRAVSVSWNNGGWNLDAFVVGDPEEWAAGCRVFFPEAA